MRLTLALFFLFTVSSISYAAFIHGTVYDADTFEPANEAVVTINTTPIQRIIAKEGDYSFEVTQGSYTIIARLFNQGKLVSFAKENITIVQNGNYSLDLLLFTPSEFYSEELLTFDTGIEELIQNEQQPKSDSTSFAIALGLGLVILLALVLVMYSMNKKNQNTQVSSKIQKIEKDKKSDFTSTLSEKERLLDPELREILKVLRENEGRMTQLELRKHFPLSEAKVSLMVAELENLGLIKKFKRGRGNIIKLV